MSSTRPMRSPRGYVVGSIVLLILLAVVCWLNRPEPPPNSMYIPAIESGGLGLTRTAWEARYADGKVFDSSSAFYHLVGVDTAAWVRFTQSTNQEIVRHVQVHLSLSGIKEAEARAIGMSLLPTDATFIRRAGGPFGRDLIDTTDIMVSAALAQFCPVPDVSMASAKQTEPGEIHLQQTRRYKDASPYLLDVDWTCPEG